MMNQVKELVERVRLIDEDIVPYLKAKYPHMYLGRDNAWCRTREDALLLLLKSYDAELLLDAQLDKVLKEDLALIDREQEEKEWPNTQLIIEHLSDIIITAEEHHDERGNSTQTLFKMDLDRIAQAIDILKLGFTHSIIPLAEALKEEVNNG